MKYVTIAMIMAHSCKSKSAVVRALAVAGIQAKKERGVKGCRYELAAINRWLPRQWPERGPMKLAVEEAR